MGIWNSKVLLLLEFLAFVPQGSFGKTLAVCVTFPIPPISPLKFSGGRLKFAPSLGRVRNFSVPRSCFLSFQSTTAIGSICVLGREWQYDFKCMVEYL